MDKGVYALVLANSRRSLCIGSLGVREFEAGWHVYVGSALGSGGLARAERHIRLHSLRDRPPRWHIDHLLIDPGFTLSVVVCAPTLRDWECDLARQIGGAAVPGFGCSDCTCSSHLFYRPKNPLREVVTAFEALKLDACIKTIKNERSKDKV
jgi:Uri superfamily endonuclease